MFDIQTGVKRLILGPLLDKVIDLPNFTKTRQSAFDDELIGTTFRSKRGDGLSKLA